MCVCVRASPLDTEDKDISELGAARRCEITDVRACVTSKQEGFAGVVKPGHLGNSIGGIGQVKFIDDVNLVVLIRSKSQSWGRDMEVSDAQRWVKTPLRGLNLTAGF